MSRKEQRPELRFTASQALAEETGISQQRAEELLKHATEKERAKVLKDVTRKSPFDKVFDRLAARQHLLLEAFGFLNDWSDCKGYAVHETIIGVVRDAQDELKKQYPEIK